MLTRLLMLPAGPRAKWIVLVLWLLPLLALGRLSSEFTSVQKNDPSNFTPKGAESTRVDELQQTVFPNGKQLAAIVVYHRAAGLTPADESQLRADFNYYSSPGRPPSTAAPIRGMLSRDHMIDSFSMAIDSSDATEIEKVVDAMRARIGRGSDGLDIRVTGPAGLTVDAIKVFGSIGGLVLGATLGLVLVLLLAIYRSPIVALIPIIAVGAAYTIAAAIIYLLAKNTGLTVDGESGGLLPVLMFGAGTDYALLLVARYREELHRHEDRHKAMAEALRNVSPAILSSGSTVLIAMLVLLLATLRSTHNLGPVLAIGVGAALLAGLTLLPALLQIVGRGAFWPQVPHVDAQPAHERSLWGRIGNWVAGRPGTILAVSVVALLLMATGATTAQEKLNSLNGFRTSTDSTDGFAYIQASEPAGVLSPTNIAIRPPSAAPAVLKAAYAVPGVIPAKQPLVKGSGGWMEATIIFADDPYGSAALARIGTLRSAVHAAVPPGALALVGGESAVTRDTQDASNADLRIIAPTVLLVILGILCLLLRALVAPLYLIATVVLSFFSSFGVSVLAFRYLFNFEGIDAGTPTLLFLFLVALGVDYNIFLMSRVREEAGRHGTREGAIRGLAATGSIITSAGLILAGTFAVLAVLPLKLLAEIGFAVAFGVLLDTVVVRAILVPALVLKVGDLSWWPGKPQARQ